MQKIIFLSLAVVDGILISNQPKRAIAIFHSVAFFALVFFIGKFCAAQAPVQLAPPLLKYQSVFFKNTAAVEIKFAQPGTQIHYTINNQPPALQSKIYTKPIRISKSFTTVKTFVSGAGFLPSQIISATFIGDGFKISYVQQSPANAGFKGNGATALIDNEGGIADMDSKTWLGYQQDSIEINAEFEKRQLLTSVLINCLRQQDNWIFLPAEITVYYFDEGSQSFQLLATQLNTPDEKAADAASIPVLIRATKKAAAKKIKIILKGIKELPGWHAGKGQQAWVFIDEIKVY
jgi:hypothetical protein